MKDEKSRPGALLLLGSDSKGKRGSDEGSNEEHDSWDDAEDDDADDGEERDAARAFIAAVRGIAEDEVSDDAADETVAAYRRLRSACR